MKGGEERVLPPSSRALRASHAPKILFPFPWKVCQNFSQTVGNKWKVFTRNIEIFVKPPHYFNSIFVTFLSCQCSLLQYKNSVIKTFIKDNVLHYVRNLIHYFSKQIRLNSLCPLLNREFPVQSHNIDQYQMQLFADLPVRVRS